MPGWGVCSTPEYPCIAPGEGEGMWAHVCVREGDRDKKTKRQKEEDRDRERGGDREGFRDTHGLKLGTLLMPPPFSPIGGQVVLMFTPAALDSKPWIRTVLSKWKKRDEERPPCSGGDRHAGRTGA